MSSSGMLYTWLECCLHHCTQHEQLRNVVHLVGMLLTSLYTTWVAQECCTPGWNVAYIIAHNTSSSGMLYTWSECCLHHCTQHELLKNVVHLVGIMLTPLYTTWVAQECCKPGWNVAYTSLHTTWKVCFHWLYKIKIIMFE